jgi:hypothetical protein
MKKLMGVSLALALSAASLFPGKLWALWAEKTTYTYYSDATFSTVVGRCVENGCTGTITCSGQQTEFETTSTVPISCRNF